MLYANDWILSKKILVIHANLTVFAKCFEAIKSLVLRIFHLCVHHTTDYCQC